MQLVSGCMEIRKCHVSRGEVQAGSLLSFGVWKVWSEGATLSPVLALSVSKTGQGAQRLPVASLPHLREVLWGRRSLDRHYTALSCGPGGQESKVFWRSEKGPLKSESRKKK